MKLYFRVSDDLIANEPPWPLVAVLLAGLPFVDIMQVTGSIAGALEVLQSGGLDSWGAIMIGILVADPGVGGLVAWLAVCGIWRVREGRIELLRGGICLLILCFCFLVLGLFVGLLVLLGWLLYAFSLGSGRPGVRDGFAGVVGVGLVIVMTVAPVLAAARYAWVGTYWARPLACVVPSSVSDSGSDMVLPIVRDGTGVVGWAIRARQVTEGRDCATVGGEIR